MQGHSENARALQLQLQSLKAKKNLKKVQKIS
jgi:hypothetical protein